MGFRRCRNQNYQNKMTHAEFHKLPFRLVSHMSLATENLAAYKAETPKGDIILQTNTRKRKNGEFGKSVWVYIFRDKEYKTIDELLKDYNEAE